MYNADFFKDPENALYQPYNDTLIVESHSCKLFARLQVPAFYDETSKCPVVLMLHGCPGNERNIDISQNLRMAGFATVTFSYRGVWGSHGYYCFSHLVEDTHVMAEYIRSIASEYRIDSERLYVFGHSMGGFAAVNSLAEGLKASGAVILAPCDIAYKSISIPESASNLIASQKNGYFNVPSETYITDDLQQNVQKWLFVNAAEKLDLSMPYAFIGGTLDTAVPPQQHTLPIYEKLLSMGADVQYTELNDSHDFPATRVALTNQIIFYLREMEKKKDEKH